MLISYEIVLGILNTLLYVYMMAIMFAINKEKIERNMFTGVGVCYFASLIGLLTFCPKATFFQCMMKAMDGAIFPIIVLSGIMCVFMMGALVCNSTVRKFRSLMGCS